MKYLDTIENQIDLIQFYGDRRNAMVREGAYGRERESLGATISAMLLQAAPFYVSPEISDLLDDAMGSLDPNDTRLYRTDFPTEYGFVWMGGEEWPYSYKTMAGFSQTFRGFAWAAPANAAKALIFTFGASFKVGQPTSADKLTQAIDYIRYEYGTPIRDVERQTAEALDTGPDELPHEYLDVDGSLRTIAISREDYKRAISQVSRESLLYTAAVLKFMGQRIASQTEQLLPRANRRRLPEAYKGGQFISIVHLRAIDRQQVPPKPGDHRIGIRYIRRAHWHSYWCGGKSKQCLYEETHGDLRLEPRFVEATVCGPDGAPLKETSKLFAVIR